MTAPVRPLQVLLPTLGSAGDVHPFIALGLALQRRGHRATLITNPLFQPLIEQLGLGFAALGTIAEARAALADPHLFDRYRGFAVIARRAIVPAAEPVYRIIEQLADADTVVAAHTIAFGALLAREKLGVPTASVHLFPSVIRSRVDAGMIGPLRFSAAQPHIWKQLQYRLIDALLIDPQLQAVNALRRSLGLAPVRRFFNQWLHSPQLTIGLFPDWFAAPQPDWPQPHRLCGFPLWDGAGTQAPVPDALRTFLDDGPPPLLFTPGSAATRQHRYFIESVEAARRLGMRALLVANHPEQLPATLPDGVRAFGYVPFSAVLPHVAMFTHHGGIGTTAQALRAGVPQLVVPCAHDQFDNAWRIEQLGLGRRIDVSRYGAGPAAQAIGAILADAALRERAQLYAQRVDSDAALTQACEAIESLRRN